MIFKDLQGKIFHFLNQKPVPMLDVGFEMKGKVAIILLHLTTWWFWKHGPSRTSTKLKRPKWSPEEENGTTPPSGSHPELMNSKHTENEGIILTRLVMGSLEDRRAMDSISYKEVNRKTHEPWLIGLVTDTSPPPIPPATWPHSPCNDHLEMGMWPNPSQLEARILLGDSWKASCLWRKKYGEKIASWFPWTVSFLGVTREAVAAIPTAVRRPVQGQSQHPKQDSAARWANLGHWWQQSYWVNWPKSSVSGLLVLEKIHFFFL